MVGRTLWKGSCHSKMGRMLQYLFACLAVGIAFTLACLAPAAAMAESISDVTGIELGMGYTVYTRATIDQTNIKQEALAAIKKWRQDALADARIKFIYNGTNYTIPEYLKANGMSVEEYLNPSWSNTMERIAIQRVIKWSDTRPVNRRPNRELWYRAGLNGINTNGEVFAQGASDIGAAIDYFGSCKPAFIDGQSTGDVTEEYIYYVWLVDPGVRCYGLAYCNCIACGERLYLPEKNASTDQFELPPISWTWK